MLLKNSKLSSHNKNKFHQWKYYNWPLFCLKNFLAQFYRGDMAIQQINHYPADKWLWNVLCCPPARDLSNSVIQPLNNHGLENI